MRETISIGETLLNTDTDLDILAKIDYDTMVYSYEVGSYDGSGFAAFNIGDKWFYQELGHCSCNGPLDSVLMSKHMLLSLEQVILVAETNYSDHGKKVASFLRKNYTEALVKTALENLALRYDIPSTDPDFVMVQSYI